MLHAWQNASLCDCKYHSLTMPSEHTWKHQQSLLPYLSNKKFNFRRNHMLKFKSYAFLGIRKTADLP